MTGNDPLKRLLEIIGDETTFLVGFNVVVKETFENYRPVDDGTIRSFPSGIFDVNISLRMGRESAERVVRIGNQNGQHTKPAKMPSDDDIELLWSDIDTKGLPLGKAVPLFARALLAEYGHPTIPEGWQLVPKALIEFIEAKEHHLPIEDRYALSNMLKAAPKFGGNND